MLLAATATETSCNLWLVVLVLSVAEQVVQFKLILIIGSAVPPRFLHRMTLLTSNSSASLLRLLSKLTTSSLASMYSSALYGSELLTARALDKFIRPKLVSRCSRSSSKLRSTLRLKDSSVGTRCSELDWTRESRWRFIASTWRKSCLSRPRRPEDKRSKQLFICCWTCWRKKKFF